MSKYLFEVEAKLDVGFVDAQQYILKCMPYAGVCFDTSTLEVKLWLDEWCQEQDDFFARMYLDGLILGWTVHKYIEVVEDE